MLFEMKIQPVDFSISEQSITAETVKHVATKSRFKRLFERQIPSILRTSSMEKIGAVIVEQSRLIKDGSGEFEPSSVCLAKMVQNFIEESHEKPTVVKCSRNRCNCFNGICYDSSEDDHDGFSCFGEPNFSSWSEACEILKSLVPCASVFERNLLADAVRVMEMNKICKHKDDVCRQVLTDGLIALGYNSSICKSRWEKTSSFPAGEYEYIDVVLEGERLLIDIDFRSEFEIARSTKTYKTILQSLPHIFVGKAERLQRIIGVVTDAAKQSLKKKGMHFPPWRKVEYVKAKWLSSHTRISPPTITIPSKLTITTTDLSLETPAKPESNWPVTRPSESGVNVDDEPVFQFSDISEWKPPAIDLKKKSSPIGVKIVTGLASVMEDDEP